MKVIIYLVLNWMRYLTRLLKKLNNAPIGALITIIGMDSWLQKCTGTLIGHFSEIEFLAQYLLTIDPWNSVWDKKGLPRTYLSKKYGPISDPPTLVNSLTDFVQVLNYWVDILHASIHIKFIFVWFPFQSEKNLLVRILQASFQRATF